MEGCAVHGHGAPVPGMLLPRFELESPMRVAQATRLLADAGAEGAVLAGGTDLLVKMKRGLARPRLLISLSRIPELEGIELSAGRLRVGAATRMSTLASAGLLAGPWRALAEGAAAVGGPLVRNRATVGGNLVNARPCADTAPPLAALGAVLELTSQRGVRQLELDGFILGPGQTKRQADEIVTAIVLPSPPPRCGSCYLKLTRRAAMEVTIVGVAASVVLDEERIWQARIVLTSVAPVPLRARAAERCLVGELADERSVRAAAASARGEAAPIDDHRAPASYRSEMVEVLTRRALTQAIARAEAGHGASVWSEP